MVKNIFLSFKLAKSSKSAEKNAAELLRQFAWPFGALRFRSSLSKNRLVPLDTERWRVCLKDFIGDSFKSPISGANNLQIF